MFCSMLSMGAWQWSRCSATLQPGADGLWPSAPCDITTEPRTCFGGPVFLLWAHRLPDNTPDPMAAEFSDAASLSADVAGTADFLEREPERKTGSNVR